MTVMAANAGRCPVSAQCRILGVPRSTCYHMLANPPAPKAQDRAREVRYRRLEAKDMQDIERERPIQRVFRARADGLAPRRPARRRQRPRAGLRRPQTLHTRRRRPHLRARWVALALRVPAG